MKFDQPFWNKVNQRLQNECFEHSDRLRNLLKLIKDFIEEHMDEYTNVSSHPFVIAIDGRAASGKSTLAEQLGKLLDADVIHMDDFFLPPQLRSDNRLAEAGGNVHYERFCEEVLPHLTLSVAFSYRIFDCSRMDYNGERTIENHCFRIVEGSYSHHPKFGDYADLFVFSDVEAEEQMRRIRLRNGEEKAQMFAKKWIPMEERYFDEFNVRRVADLNI